VVGLETTRKSREIETSLEEGMVLNLLIIYNNLSSLKEYSLMAIIEAADSLLILYIVHRYNFQINKHLNRIKSKDMEINHSLILSKGFNKTIANSLQNQSILKVGSQKIKELSSLVYMNFIK
jgi:hypothetical protein